MTTTPEKQPNNCKKGIHADGMCYCLEDKPAPEAEGIGELEMAMVGLVNTYCLKIFGQQMPDTFKNGEFVIPELIKDSLQKFLHHQLQKVRHDWLREEIVRLEGMKRNLTGLVLPSEEFGRAHSYNQALQTIIDRYQAELDQDVNK